MFRIAEENLAGPIDTFCMSLRPAKSPYLVKGALDPSALRGKELFSGKAGCAVCHLPPLYADALLHDVAIADPYDANTEWNTPSLVECWRTAPYSHLGSMNTVREMIDTYMVRLTPAASLSTAEIDDLTRYVLSL